jgi:hypothetical protein
MSFKRERIEYAPPRDAANVPMQVANRGGRSETLQNTTAIMAMKKRPVFLLATDHRKPLSRRTMG